MQYFSETDQDFKCLETYIANGAFGKLNDIDVHVATQDIGSLNNFFNIMHRGAKWIPPGQKPLVFTSKDAAIPTIYDSPLQYRILNNLVVDLKEAASRLGIDVSDFPHHACIPTRKVNACAVCLPCASRPFLLFDSQLFFFCYLFAKAFSHCLPSSHLGVDRVTHSIDISVIQNRLKDCPKHLKILSDVLDNYVRLGTPAYTRPFPPLESHLSLSIMVTTGMEMFVVGHEFGHVYAGHVSSLIPGLRANAISLDGLSLSHQMEHQADLLGLFITIEAMKERGYDCALAVFGAYIFFIALEVSERYSHLISGGKYNDWNPIASESHPSNLQRRIFLKESLECLVADKGEADAAKALCQEYEGVYQYLWSAIANRHIRLKKVNTKRYRKEAG